jgi:hypothetical protein
MTRGILENILKLHYPFSYKMLIQKNHEISKLKFS